MHTFDTLILDVRAFAGRIARTLSFKHLTVVLGASAVLGVMACPAEAQVSQAEAKVLSFVGSVNQSSVVSLTADPRTQTTGWTGATYSATNGVVVQVAPGTFSVGFGSFIPGNYTGPGAHYLHRVVITDQNGAVIMDEPFDGWTQTSTTTTGNITRATYTTASGRVWGSYENAPTIYQGYGVEFTQVNTGGDIGIVYPMDGFGPFSVLTRTVITVPPGTTELRINVDWRYNVNNSSGAARTFTVGLREGAAPPEDLFSFSAPVVQPVPTLSEWAMILFGTLLAGGAALYIQRRQMTV
ncbi:IPTL-CTERM sorting domain-containing protein [Brevundimonas sp.]|uniref:IPTL-CTERM sorting domain-containing protein n=1 Tax=Brevundimonas sp. TaxID=1871086 RepID=UPI003D0E021A